jgi:hypothetical protein
VGPSAEVQAQLEAQGAGTATFQLGKPWEVDVYVLETQGKEGKTKKKEDQYG